MLVKDPTGDFFPGMSFSVRELKLNAVKYLPDGCIIQDCKSDQRLIVGSKEWMQFTGQIRTRKTDVRGLTCPYCEATEGQQKSGFNRGRQRYRCGCCRRIYQRGKE